MNWFAPKVLKSEYDKVVADNMELQIEIDELKKSFQMHRKNSTEVQLKPKRAEIKTRYKWNAHFSPEELIEFILESLNDSQEIKKVGYVYYKKGEKQRVAEVLDDERIRVTQKFVLDNFKDLSYGDSPNNRMPTGSLIHLYNAGLIEVASDIGYASFNFPINGNVPAYILTNHAIKLYKEG